MRKRLKKADEPFQSIFVLRNRHEKSSPVCNDSLTLDKKTKSVFQGERNLALNPVPIHI
jgi:hypothetical protein